MAPLRHDYSPRQGRPLIVLLACWVGIIVLGAVFGAIWPVLLALAALTLPLLWEVATNRASQFTLTDSALKWDAPGSAGEIPLSRIARARLDVKFDFTTRLVVWLEDGSKHRIPPHCLPPQSTLEPALRARNVPVHKRLFPIF